MEELHKKAHELRVVGKYGEAVAIFEDIWTKENKNKWVGWEYSYSLKRIGNINKAIAVCKNTYKIDKDFDRNNDLMAWCVYEKFFRDKKESYTQHETKRLDEIGQAIIKIIRQKEGSAYENVVFSLVDIYKKQMSRKSYEKIIEWLDKLRVDLLTTDVPPSPVEQPKGKHFELSSRKEQYYAAKTKGLVRLQKYNECIECCRDAEKNLKTYHYDNDIWIPERKFYALGQIGAYEESIRGLKELTLKKEHWSLLFDIAEIYEKTGQYEKAMYYAHKALLTRDPDKMKINVIYFVAKGFEHAGKGDIARRHYAYYKKIRLQNGWNISSDIERLLLESKEDLEDVTRRELEKIWLKEIKQGKSKYNGNISRIMPNGKNGFIQYGKNSIFFKINNVFGNRRIQAKANVTFIIEDSYDFSKDRKTKEAKYIEIIK